MGAKTKVLGGHTQLIANPATKASAAAAGELSLECTNGSNYAFFFSVHDFQSPTPTVATASFAGSKATGSATGTINISGRISRQLKPQTEKIGEWHPIAAGPGDLAARVDFSNRAIPGPGVVSVMYVFTEKVTVT